MKKTLLFCLIFNFLLISTFVTAQQNTKLDLLHVPFSHYGSYMSIMLKKAPGAKSEALYIQDNSGRRLWHWKGVFKIEATYENMVIPITKIIANPAQLRLQTEKGEIKIAYQSPNILRFKGKGTGMKLTQSVKNWSSVSFPINEPGSQWRCQQAGYDHYVFTGLKGKVKANPAHSVAGGKIPDRPQFILDIVPDENGNFEAAFEQYYDARATKTYHKDFAVCVKESQDQLEEFSKKLLPVPENFSALTGKPMRDSAYSWTNIFIKNKKSITTI